MCTDTTPQFSILAFTLICSFLFLWTPRIPPPDPKLLSRAISTTLFPHAVEGTQLRRRQGCNKLHLERMNSLLTHYCVPLGPSAVPVQLTSYKRKTVPPVRSYYIILRTFLPTTGKF